MAEVKEKHPTWFKMKIERRQLIKQLPPETADAYRKNCFLRILPGYGRGVAAI